MSIMEYKEKNVSNWKNKKGQWFSGKGILVLVWPRWVLSFTKCKVYCFTGLIENMCLLLTTFCHFISPCTGLTCSESVEKFRYGPVEQESRRWEAAGWESAVSRQPPSYSCSCSLTDTTAFNGFWLQARWVNSSPRNLAFDRLMSFALSCLLACKRSAPCGCSE